MEHNDVYKQTFSNAKRNAAISVALVGALLVGGVKVGSYFNKKNDKTPIDATPQTTMIDPATSELVLTEDFDINNDEQVNIEKNMNYLKKNILWKILKILSTYLMKSMIK